MRRREKFHFSNLQIDLVYDLLRKTSGIDRRMIRHLAATLGLLFALSACATSSSSDDVPEDNVLAPLAPPEEVFVPSVPGAEPGYWFVGEQFSGQMSYIETPAGVEILYTHHLAGAPELIGELDPASDWLSNGQREFSGTSDRGVKIDIAMTFEPCEVRGRNHARSVDVRLGRLRYSGCATETGPFPAWSDGLYEFLPAIDACLAAGTSSTLPILHARYERGQTLIRARFGEAGDLWECAVRDGAARWYELGDSSFMPLDQDSVIYVVGRRPRDLDGCYHWETVLNDRGRAIGALGEDACGMTSPPPQS
jgi:hypothetical protein